MFKNLIKTPIRFLMKIYGHRFEKLFNKEFYRSEVKRILVFQTGGIGDILRIFPLIEILRSEFPYVKISTLTEYPPEIFKLMENRNYIDESIRFNFKMNFLKKMAFLFELQKSNYDLVINPARGSGMFECSIITFLIGRKWRVGFIKDGIGSLYTNKIDFRDNESILKQNIDLLRSIGINGNSKDPTIKIEIPIEDLLFAQELIKEAKDKNRIIVAVSPTVSNHPELVEWPVGNYVELSRSLIDNKNASIILLGSEKECEMSSYFEKKLGEKIYFKNLVGKTDLFKACALIKSCDLFVGNDSGLLHIANALNVPSIGIFGPTSPEQDVSFMNKNVVIIKHKVPCSPCYVHQPDFNFKCEYRNKCLTNITVDDAVKATELLIGHKYDDIDYKIPPDLPLPKGGNKPLFGKEEQGEIFH
jgi:heptosyltransferase-2